MILTKSISRFTRNTVDLLASVRKLKTLGVAIRFEREGIDTLSADGELLLTLLASFAQAESACIGHVASLRVEVFTCKLDNAQLQYLRCRVRRAAYPTEPSLVRCDDQGLW
ncbi:recombinase family protein [Arcanobacterium canis]